MSDGELTEAGINDVLAGSAAQHGRRINVLPLVEIPPVLDEVSGLGRVILMRQPSSNEEATRMRPAECNGIGEAFVGFPGRMLQHRYHHGRFMAVRGASLDENFGGSEHSVSSCFSVVG